MTFTLKTAIIGGQVALAVMSPFWSDLIKEEITTLRPAFNTLLITIIFFYVRKINENSKANKEALAKIAKDSANRRRTDTKQEGEETLQGG